MRNALEILDVNDTQLEDVLRRVEETLDEKDAALIRALFQSYTYVAGLVEDKNTSIRRLRQLFFGKRTEKTKAVVETAGSKPEATPQSNAAARLTDGEPDKSKPDEADTAPAAKGHGRNGADAYRGAARIDVSHPSLKAGDACPACAEGIVYNKAPGVLVRIIGQPPLSATIYELQKLRCHLCGAVFTAAAPEAAPYVEIGTNVRPDSIVGRIDALGRTSTVAAGLAGRMIAILVADGQTVEYGQPLATIESGQ